MVVGGGVIGLLSARELASGGCRVRLLEMNGVGRASSWAGGGILSPLYPWRYPDPVTELARWSQAAYPELAERLRDEGGIDPEWTRNGMLMLDTSDQVQARSWAERFGYRLELLDGVGLRQCEPALADGDAALWMADVAQVRNPRLVRAVRHALVKQGGLIEEGCEVTELLVRGGRVAGVRTMRGDFSADVVVMAAGAWSGRLLAELAVRPEIRPVRGQMLLFRGPPGLVSRIILGPRHYVIPRRDGRVLVGSTMEEVGFDSTTTAAAREELLAAAVGLVPALAACELERHWAGLRPGSPDGVPYIGEHPEVAGLYLNSGHFRNGVVLAPASARLLADLVLGRAPLLDPAAYGVRRYRQ
ncbi:glycine oxidase ThiO [Sulfurivermis fontis]|uniref:glycine oxidase ThiO n=1 Tax=Sulfurivermis fontis TaxID=1972068 RepID=UPI0030842032